MIILKCKPYSKSFSKHSTKFKSHKNNWKVPLKSSIIGKTVWNNTSTMAGVINIYSFSPFFSKTLTIVMDIFKCKVAFLHYYIHLFNTISKITFITQKISIFIIYKRAPPLGKLKLHKIFYYRVALLFKFHKICYYREAILIFFR